MEMTFDSNFSLLTDNLLLDVNGGISRLDLAFIIVGAVCITFACALSVPVVVAALGISAGVSSTLATLGFAGGALVTLCGVIDAIIHS